MRDGKLITTGPIEDFDTPKLIKAMVGRELSYEYPEKSGKVGDVIFEAKTFILKKYRISLLK